MNNPVTTTAQITKDTLVNCEARACLISGILWIAMIIICLSVSRVEAASVPVPNGNFESLTGTLPTSWSLVYGNGYEFSSTLRVHGGSRSLKIVDGSSSLAGAMRSAPIPVIEGRKYTAKVWANVDTGGGGDVALYLEYWNSQGTKMLTYSTSASPTLDTWTQLQVASQFAPYGAAYCTLMVYSSNAYAGQMFFDDATLDVNDINFAAVGGVAVDDPGMEGGSGTGLPSAWTAYAANGFESGSTTIVYAGSRSVKIADTSASLSGGILSKKFSVAEGKSYVATVKYNVASLTAGSFKVYIQYFDNGETDYTPSEYLSAVIFPATTTSSWQTLTMNFTPPFLARYAAILLYSDNACVGTCYFDNVTVAAKSTGLSNGNFESVDLNNYPLNWSGYGTNASVKTSINTVANRVFDISRSLMLVDSSASLGGGAQSNQITNVTAGASYTATAMVYVESGSATFYLQYFDSNDAVLSGSPAAAVVSTTGSWQQATVTGVAPVNTAYARLLCYSAQANVGTAYFDTVTFSKDIVAVTNLKQLFIDDYILQSLNGVTKTFNQCTKQGQIISGRSGTWEPNVWMYGSVVDDPTAPAAERYKLYYVGSGLNCYRYSSDCLNWVEPGVTSGVPGLGLYTWGGSTNNNILGSFGAPSTGCVVMDPTEPVAAKRFKMLGSYYRPDSSIQIWWYRNYTSSDGKNFIGSTPTNTLNGWDVATAALDTTNAKWVGSYKYYDSNIHRVHRMSQSTDHGNTWSVPIRAESLADGIDATGYVVTDCYGMGWYVVDGVYIGIAWELYIQDLAGSDAGPVGTQLVFSRDLTEDWYRPSRLAPIPWGAPGSFDAGTIYTGNAVDVGNEVYWYYGASQLGHAAGNLNIGLAKWRRDGFMSLNSGSTEGTILTKKLTYTGSALVLNLVSTGTGNYVKAELLDSTGAIITGYNAANSAVLNVDSVSQTVTWNGSSALPAAGTVVQVKLYCKNARVYSLKFQ
ncbi:MAG: carbohydrate binding domain-containing protein [Opitutae bacterium]|nr:carbohydrate binding domain-containing protein [Opitutae bacterium]